MRPIPTAVPSGVAVLLTLLGLLSGCGGGIVAPSGESFPAPAVAPLPLRVGIHYDEAFSGFTHEEEIQGRGAFTILVGPPQMRLFDTITGALFESTTPVADLRQDTLAAYDAVLVPEVDRFEFAIPANARGNFFEVWIRYQVAVLNSDGTKLAEYPVIAYGKTRNLFLDGDAEALRDALVTALRDAGAYFLISFMQDPAVRSWLEARTVAIPEGWPEPRTRRRRRS